MPELRAGIIGLGVGEQHIAGYEAHPGCVVTALCDFDPAKEEMARAKYPDKRFYRRDTDLLDDPDIDVVSIASFDDYHHAQLVRALNNRKHVFVEKPLCQFEEQLRDIRLGLINNPDLLISSNLILRQSPRFLWLKEQIDQGHMGRIYYMEGDYNYGRLHKIIGGWRGKLDFLLGDPGRGHPHSGPFDVAQRAEGGGGHGHGQQPHEPGQRFQVQRPGGLFDAHGGRGRGQVHRQFRLRDAPFPLPVPVRRQSHLCQRNP